MPITRTHRRKSYEERAGFKMPINLKCEQALAGESVFEYMFPRQGRVEDVTIVIDEVVGEPELVFLRDDEVIETVKPQSDEMLSIEDKLPVDKGTVLSMRLMGSGGAIERATVSFIYYTKP